MSNHADISIYEVMTPSLRENAFLRAHKHLQLQIFSFKTTQMFVALLRC